jgi:spermidine synthase
VTTTPAEPRSAADDPPVRPPEPETVGLRHALAIGIAVFVSGAVLLGLEIAASRVLAPFFGNSLFVWGALIGVVLAGLSVGYWAGGALADRLPATRLLLAVMALGGGLVLLVPYADGHVLEWVVEWDPGPRANPLIAAIALFGLPSIVFASVTPIAVRLVARSVASVGRTAGRLFAISTAGSIAGTFATAFFLIPEFGTNQLLALAATAMFGAVGLVSLVERAALGLVIGIAAAVGAGAASVSLAPDQGRTLEGVAARNWSPVYRGRDEISGGSGIDFASQGYKVVFEKDTRYHHLAVVDDQDSRYLRFDSSFQSGMFLDRPYATRFDYSEYFQLALAYRPTIRNVLFIGVGGGSALKRLWRDFPDLEIQAVEIDPVVVDVAYEYFEMPRSPRLQVEVEDGRRFLTEDDRRWDAIMIDAYYSDSIPFHLTTQEFLQLVQSRLRPGGLVISNVIGSIRGTGSELFRSFYRTYRTVFPTVLVHPVVSQGEVALDDRALRNIMLLATEGAAPAKPFLQSRARELRQDFPRGADLTTAIRSRRDIFIPTRDVPTLTDDYAPTDSLLVIQ